jgi:hypothetical protein
LGYSEVVPFILKTEFKTYKKSMWKTIDYKIGKKFIKPLKLLPTINDDFERTLAR